jgi:hypothetical protein
VALALELGRVDAERVDGERSLAESSRCRPRSVEMVRDRDRAVRGRSDLPPAARRGGSGTKPACARTARRTGTRSRAWPETRLPRAREDRSGVVAAASSRRKRLGGRRSVQPPIRLRHRTRAAWHATSHVLGVDGSRACPSERARRSGTRSASISSWRIARGRLALPAAALPPCVNVALTPLAATGGGSSRTSCGTSGARRASFSSSRRSSPTCRAAAWPNGTAFGRWRGSASPTGSSTRAACPRSTGRAELLLVAEEFGCRPIRSSASSTPGGRARPPACVSAIPTGLAAVLERR